jgi:hypothetical protein
MTVTTRSARRLSAVVSAVGLITAACHRTATDARAPATSPSPVPTLPTARITASPSISAGAVTTAAPDEEARVTLITGDHDMDVKQALEYIARRGGYGLVMSPNLKSRVRLNLVDVPVSEALQTVLAEANLTLSPTNGKVEVLWNPTVVFYQLPMNVDSLSVEAIMKRYGLSRDMAQVIVAARRP